MHGSLWQKLLSIGVSSRIVKIFSSLYSCVSLEILDEGGSPINIKITKGVLQGDSGSPILFSLYNWDIENFSEKRTVTVYH